jgi:hypothetical protein
MNEFAVNFASERVDHRYLEILVVGKAIPVKVLCDDLAMRDRFGIGVEIQSNPIPHGDAVFHIEEKFLHGSQPWFRSALVSISLGFSQPWFVLLASQFLFLNKTPSDMAICRR